MKKFTIEYVRSVFEAEDYIPMFKEYINVHTPIEFKCPNDHFHKISFGAFRKGQRCKKCIDDKLRFSIEYVRNHFKDEGYVLLSKEYINSQHALNYICTEGHRGSITFGSWRCGNRCRYCAKNVKHTIGFVKAAFEKEGYRLFSTHYINQKQRLKYSCPLGHIHEMTWTDWRNGGCRCPTCHQIKMFGEGNHQWKGGVSYEPYCEVWKDKEYKNDIKERDGNICLNPYCDSKYPNDLTIHHIDYDKKNCEPRNLITLCRVCNIKANKDRRWHKTWYKAILFRRYNI